MPNLDKPLTITRLAKLEFPTSKKGDRIIYWDSIFMPSFGVKITRSGGKSYIVKYEISGNDSSYIIGRCDVWELDNAREEAARILKEASNGIRPQKKSQQSTRLIDLSHLYVICRQEGKEGQIKASTIKDYWKCHRTINRLPIGKMEAEKIMAHDVKRMMSSLNDKQKTANRLRGHIDRVLRWSMGEGLIAEKIIPTTLVKKFQYTPNQPRYQEGDPAKIMQYLENIKTGKSRDQQGRRIDPMWIAFTYCVLLSGARPSEIASARLDELDTDLYALIKREHKTSRTKGDKPIYLVNKAWQELHDYIQYKRPHKLVKLDINTSPFIFPSPSKEGHITHWFKFDRQMRTALNIEASIYACRRNFSKIGKRTFDGDRERVAQVTGHETLEMIDTYAGKDELLIKKERRQAAKDNKDIAEQIILQSQHALNNDQNNR